MTKQNEIDLIKDLASKLDHNTYCGPWLREMIPFIESDMRSDYPIDIPNLRKLRDETIFLQRELEKNRNEANEKIQKMYVDAKKQVKDYKNALRENLERSLQKLSQETRKELWDY